MTPNRYKLAVIPEGWKVVPEEFIKSYVNRSAIEVLNASPPIDTPPVLRWENNRLVLFGKKHIAYVHKQYLTDTWINSIERIRYNTEQEARLAAQKALGFPDGLIIDEE